MAKMRSRTIERPQSDAELDDSSDHPALTPLMRRLAREKWDFVRARAAEQWLPIVEAWISPSRDEEGGPLVFLAVHLDCSRERASAFRRSLDPDYDRWESQLNEEEWEAAVWIPLAMEGVAKAPANGA